MPELMSPLVYKGLFAPENQYVLGDIVFATPNTWMTLILEGSSAQSAGGFYVCNAPANWQSYASQAIPGEIKRQGHLRPGVPSITPIDIPASCPFSVVDPFIKAGPPGPQGAPGIGTAWKGSWGTNTSYNINDMVMRNLGVYIANQPISASDPAPGASGGSPKWSVVSSPASEL